MHRLFHVVGAAGYLAQPARRDLVRRNLERICGWLVAEGRATPRVARAVREPRAMDRLVRDAFSHHARYYLEVLRRQTLTMDYLEAHIEFGGWESILNGFEALETGRGLMYVGLHYGSMEVPAQYAITRTGQIMLTPMETVADPAMQAWVVEQREPIGLEIIDPTRAAATAGLGTQGWPGRHRLRPADRRGRPAHELFGVPAQHPSGQPWWPSERASRARSRPRVGLAMAHRIDLFDLPTPAPDQPMRPESPPSGRRSAGHRDARGTGTGAVVDDHVPIWDDIR
jgi:lauroyl/myristoyl acyltransferase